MITMREYLECNAHVYFFLIFPIFSPYIMLCILASCTYFAYFVFFYLSIFLYVYETKCRLLYKHKIKIQNIWIRAATINQ